MASFWRDVLYDIRAKYQDRVDEEAAWIQDDDILKAAMAMLEAKVKKDRIKDLLIKYWNLRPSEAEGFIREAEDRLKK